MTDPYPPRAQASTQASVHFLLAEEPAEITAKLHILRDGMPDGPHGIRQSLERFLTEIESQVQEPRTVFADPGALAALYVTWLTLLRAEDQGKPLAVPSIGITSADPDEISYVYKVLSGRSGRPQIRYELVAAGGDEAEA